MSTPRRPAVLLPVLVGHVLAAAWVWRDLAQRPAARVRGAKNLWRVLSALNTSGSAAYVLLGRRG